MAEPSEGDLRRLRSLEKRLAKADDKAKSFAAEASELRRKLTAAERAAKRAEKLEAELRQSQAERAGLADRLQTAEDRAGHAEAAAESASQQLAELNSRVEALIEENRSRAQRLDEMDGDLERFRKEAESGHDRVETARAEAKEAKAGRVVSERERKTLQRECDRLRSRLVVLEAQLTERDIPALLPPEHLSGLLDRFAASIAGGLMGFQLKDCEVKLNVAMGAAGDQSGFLIPTAGAPAELRQNLQELTFRLGRSPVEDEEPR